MKFCMKCMSQYSDDYNICPMCGFEEGTLPTDSRCMEPGPVLADRYIVGMPLAIDGWLVRYIGYDALTNRKVVINEYHPARYAVREPGQIALKIIKQKPFYRYMSILLKKAGQLSETHVPENVLNVCECFEKNNTAYVITEYSEGKSLEDYIKEKAPMRPEAAEKLILPMLRSLDKLHDNGFISGGFSPSSFIVTDENELILSDYLGNMFFNIADNDDTGRMGENVRYFPPERYDDTDTVDITPENDVFSSAMLIYALLGTKLPDGNERAAVFKKKHKEILKTPSSLKNDKSKEIALINAACVDPSMRTPDMETLIKEFTGARKAELRSKQKKGGLPLWAKIAIPTASAVLVLGVAAAICIPMLMPKQDEPDVPVIAETMTTGQTIVPSILNYELSAATEELKKSGLILEIEGREVNDEKDENIVISQSVERGSIVEENTVIGVKINVHSGEFTLPNFLGIDNKSCTDVLESIGLNYSIAMQYNENISPGCVVSQSITPYTKVKAGQRIDIIVSQGPEPKQESEPSSSVSDPVSVPQESDYTPAVTSGAVREYTGGSYESAVTPSKDNNFPVEVASRVYDDSKPEGTVVQQYPAAGTSQKTDEPVKLVVSSANKSVLVPDVKMLNKEAATRMIDYCGLKAEFTEAESDTAAEGLIESQSPEAGETVAPGETVKIVISKGRKKVSMPDIQGKTMEEALKTLKNIGLSVKVSYGSEKDKENGIVLSQSISSGSEVTVGSEVLIVVNSGSSIVEVPDIIGLTVEEADKKAVEAGLNLLIYVNDEHPYREGKVSAQGPHAGMKAEKGSDLVVLLIDDKAIEASKDSTPEKSSGADITISPESVSIKKGENFVLKISTKGIDDLYKVEYDISDETVINAVHIDKETMDMTFLGMKPGTSEIKISCGDIIRTCKVTVN